MTVQPAPEKKMPWLYIAIGAIAVLCLCALVIGAASFAFFLPASSSVEITEEPIAVATAEPTLVEVTPETTLPTEVPAQADANPLFAESAAAGSPVEIGNNMTLTILDVTRPADEIVANGNSFNTTASEGDEFIQVQVEVMCASEAGSKCTFYPTVMKVVLSDGSTRDLQTFIEGVDDWDTSIEIEGGATEKGVLLFIVPKSETQLVISYQDIYADQPLYMQLP